MGGYNPELAQLQYNILQTFQFFTRTRQIALESHMLNLKKLISIKTISDKIFKYCRNSQQIYNIDDLFKKQFIIYARIRANFADCQRLKMCNRCKLYMQIVHKYFMVLNINRCSLRSETTDEVLMKERCRVAIFTNLYLKSVYVCILRIMNTV
ncbi:Hypothetical_protein [Hexamita inflata]|uniref:Hypothetical_protein n=1 Tax=Hexamita inflata TaxID=28002 RepID=A0AA86R645_9EUKA|nr:Hypothetical protein HINF_LOCUS54264 [Hexamita inflata]